MAETVRIRREVQRRTFPVSQKSKTLYSMTKKLTRLIALLFLSLSAFGQVAYQLAPVPHQQFFDANGNPLAGGLVYTYSAGSSTPLATYKDNAGTANTNPIVLDAGGFATIYLGQNSYKFIVQNSSAVQQWSQDNVQNIAQVILTTANVWTAAQTFNGLINFLGGTSDTTGADGNVFYRTDLHRLRFYETGGSAWHSIAGLDTTDTLTNKTLTTPTITSPTITGTDSGTETLVNKTLTSPTVNTPALTSPTIGGGTTLARYARYTAVLSPTSVAANTTAEQCPAAVIITSGDILISVRKPTSQAGLGIVGWRENGTGVCITFSNNTGSPITPTASETYQFVGVQ